MNFSRTVSWGLAVVLLLFAAQFVWYETTRDPTGEDFVPEPPDTSEEASGTPPAGETLAAADLEPTAPDETPTVADETPAVAHTAPPPLDRTPRLYFFFVG